MPQEKGLIIFLLTFIVSKSLYFMCLPVEFSPTEHASCEEPQPPQNGYMLGTGSLYKGSELAIYCERGYRLQGPASLTCIPANEGAPEDGAVWWPDGQFTCVKITGEMAKNLQ